MDHDKRALCLGLLSLKLSGENVLHAQLTAFRKVLPHVRPQTIGIMLKRLRSNATCHKVTHLVDLMVAGPDGNALELERFTGQGRQLFDQLLKDLKIPRPLPQDHPLTVETFRLLER